MEKQGTTILLAICGVVGFCYMCAAIRDCEKQSNTTVGQESAACAARGGWPSDRNGEGFVCKEKGDSK